MHTCTDRFSVLSFYTQGRYLRMSVLELAMNVTAAIHHRHYHHHHHHRHHRHLLTPRRRYEVTRAGQNRQAQPQLCCRWFIVSGGGGGEGHQVKVRVSVTPHLVPPTPPPPPPPRPALPNPFFAPSSLQTVSAKQVETLRYVAKLRSGSRIKPQCFRQPTPYHRIYHTMFPLSYLISTYHLPHLRIYDPYMRINNKLHATAAFHFHFHFHPPPIGLASLPNPPIHTVDELASLLRRGRGWVSGGSGNGKGRGGEGRGAH